MQTCLPQFRLDASSRPGFTLIELLVVIVIIAVLTGLLMPALLNARQKSMNTEAKQAIAQLTSSMELYAAEDDRKRYPYPGPFPSNSNPYGSAAETYLRVSEASDPVLAFAIAFYDTEGGKVIPGVLTLLEGKQLPLPVLRHDPKDADRRLMDPWGHPYHYRLGLPPSVRSTFSCPHKTGFDVDLPDWNWDAVKDQESLRTAIDPAKPRPYPYIYSWGKHGTAKDPCFWLYQVDKR